MSGGPLRIAIADDHPVVRRGLRAFLDTLPGFDVVLEAADGRTLLQQLAQVAVDVALLDLLMPDGGAALVRRLQQDAAHTRLLVLTSSEDARLLLEVVQAGATSVLLKDTAPEQLRDAILATRRGERVLHPRVAALLAAQRAQTSPRPALSAREQEVLRLLTDGLGNAEIAARLGIGVKTVKTHVSHLLLKLGVEDRTQAVVRALREGLV